MSKFKVGDKFISEILEIKEDEYGNATYKLGSGQTRMFKKEYELYALQQYHEPTLVDHAQALQDNCDKHCDCEECKGCEFKGETGCKLWRYPLNWELGQTQKLTEEEIEILEYWKKQGASVIVRNDNKSCLEFLSNEIIPNERGFVGRQQYMYKIYFKELEKDKNYNIDDLLKGE